MERLIGTVSRGVRAPIIRKGDDIVEITVDSVLNAASISSFDIYDRDVIAITEAVVARAQGNYASVDQIALDIKNNFNERTLGLVFPILSRNRFATCLKGIARASKKIVLMLSYPADEVGNHLVDLDLLDSCKVNPWTDVLTETKYRELFGYPRHTFTDVDYVEYYREVVEAEDCELEIIFANDARAILNYTKDVLACDIHSRERTKRILKAAGASKVLGLDDILTSSVDGGGYNEEYGLLGSNKATEDTVKMFPRDCQRVVDKIQKLMLEKTGKHVEVMVYGDGAFKDPVGRIWELADPVVSPAFTEGLCGRPNEVKLKYLADNDFADLDGEELEVAITEYIRNRDKESTDDKATLGTTPRRITDLLGSLSDLTSGSGDKGTPIVLVQGYFDNLSI